MSDQRFYIDHDTIHDRITGKHVRTDPDFGPGRVFGEDGREECCRLLNSLAIDSAVCLKCREPHDGTQWATCEHCSVARTKKLDQLQSMLDSAMVVIESFRPLATAVRKNLEDMPREVGEAYELIADMVADADAEAAVSGETAR